jgi:Nup53/35/40-type RNA recognition motif
MQWVIVYGFKAGYVDLLLREFSKCGEILQHGTFGAPASANWLYLQFQVPMFSLSHVDGLHTQISHAHATSDAFCLWHTRLTAAETFCVPPVLQCHVLPTAYLVCTDRLLQHIVR